MGAIINQIREQFLKATEQKNVSIQDLEAADQWKADWKKRPHPHEDPKILAAEDELPGFVAYLTAMQTIALFGSMIRRHPLLGALDERIAEGENRFGPDSAASPITLSLFHSWEFFDAYFGKREGTLGSLYLSLVDRFNAPVELIEVIGRCCTSRLGIYKHLGKKGQDFQLEDLATGEVVHAVNPRAYTGRKGEIWLVRLYPAPDDRPFFAMTTPYVIQETTEKDWHAFLQKAGVKVRTDKAEDTMRALMKYPKKPFFWLDYITQASTKTKGARGDHIALNGLPKG